MGTKVAELRKLGGQSNGVIHSLKHKPLPHHVAGLSYTASGYGSRIPTEYMVWLNGKWRRIYCRIYSNIGTLFIGASPEAGFIADVYDV